MSTTIAGFRARFPQFSDPVAYPDDLIDLVILEAVRQTNPDCFEDRVDDARCYLAAHLLVGMSGGRGEGVASVTAGSSSLSFFDGTSGMGSDALGATQYGREYQRLVRLCGPSARVLC